MLNRDAPAISVNRVRTKISVNKRLLNTEQIEFRAERSGTRRRTRKTHSFVKRENMPTLLDPFGERPECPCKLSSDLPLRADRVERDIIQHVAHLDKRRRGFDLSEKPQQKQLGQARSAGAPGSDRASNTKG